MTEAEMRRVSRKELLELLIETAKENETLRASLAEAEKKLQSRDLRVENAGSLAQAAISVSRVLESADDAAALYLDNAKRLEKEAKEQYDALLEKGRADADELRRKGKADADELRTKAEAILSYAKVEAETLLAQSRGAEPEISDAADRDEKPRTGFRLFGSSRTNEKKQ